MHVFNIRLFVFNDEDKEVDVEDMHVEDTRMFEELLMETCLTILRCVAVCYSVLQFNTQHISKNKSTHGDMFDDSTMRCSVLQCVAVQYTTHFKEQIDSWRHV